MDSAKISSIVLWLFAVVGIIVFFMALNIDIEDPSTYGNADPVLYWSYVLVAIGAVLWIGSTVLSMAAKPSAIKGQMIGLGFMAVVLIISYALADGSDYATYTEEVTESTVRFSDMLLYATYILGGITIISVIFSSVVKFSK